jgi:hypothetical protein
MEAMFTAWSFSGLAENHDSSDHQSGGRKGAADADKKTAAPSRAPLRKPFEDNLSPVLFR